MQAGVPKPVSLRKSRLGGLLIALLGAALGWFVLLRPLWEGERTGHLEYSVKGVFMVPAFLYLGIAVMVTDLRDGQAFRVGVDGRKHMTPKGRWVFAGLAIVIALFAAGWWWYLRSLGFVDTSS